MADIEQVRVRRGEGPGPRPGRFCGNAVGKADSAPTAVVVTGAKPAGRQAHRSIYGEPVEQVELSDVERRVFLVGADDAYEMIDHLGDAKGRQRGIPAGQERPHFRCGRLGFQEGEHGVCIEQRQRGPSRRASAARACFRARFVLGPRPRYLPSNAPTMSSPSGRITTRSPRSTTMTWRAFQRARVSAGIDTCPFCETVMTCVFATMTALYARKASLYGKPIRTAVRPLAERHPHRA